MMYVLFCLIIRTAYQGKKFELIQKEMRPPDVENVDEMIRDNFTIYIWFDNFKLFEDMEIFKR